MKKQPHHKKSEYFQSRIKILRLMGFWPITANEDKTTRKEIAYYVCCVLLVLNAGISTILGLCETVSACMTKGKVDEHVCHQITVVIISFQLLSKMTVIALQAKRMQKLADDLNGDLYDEFVKDKDELSIMKKCSEYDRNLAIFFCAISMVIVTVNFAKPIVSTIRKSSYTNGNETVPVMGEVVSDYPFQAERSSIWYIIILIHQSLLGWPGGMLSWISDSMFCSFLSYLCGHFDILITNIQERDGLEMIAKKYVLHHRRLIAYADEMLKVYTPLMVIQLLLGGVTIAVLMIQVVVTRQGSVVLPIAYMTLKLIQLHIQCHHGQLVSDKSVAVGEAIYFSKWYDKPRTLCIDLKTIMIRSRKPFKFQYAGIFQLSSRRFGNILNTAYGYFAMMSTMRHD